MPKNQKQVKSQKQSLNDLPEELREKAETLRNNFPKKYPVKYLLEIYKQGYSINQIYRHHFGD